MSHTAINLQEAMFLERSCDPSVFYTSLRLYFNLIDLLKDTKHATKKMNLNDCFL